MNNTNPLVSIIIPCHNGEKYVADAIRSVQSQTFTDWELLVIDDASSDNSVSVIEEFCEADSRIRLFRNEKPTGMPASPRNIGISAACGRYIAFLDCDDLWLPTKLERQLPLFGTKDVAAVFSYYGKMDGGGNLQNRLVSSPFLVTYRFLLKGDCIGNLTGIYDTQKCGKVFQREIHHEDYLMWLEILRNGFCAMNTNTVEAFYRVQGGSVSGNKLNAMRWHWHILRNELRLPLPVAAYNFMHYALKGLMKFLR